MGSSFPGSLDAWGEVYDNVDYFTASHINDLRDAVEKIEAKLGAGGYNSSLHNLVVPLLDSVVDSVNKLRFWVYHNSFSATGWSVLSTGSGAMLSGKGTDTYTTGGDALGTWTIPTSHSHNVTIPVFGWSGSYGYTDKRLGFCWGTPNLDSGISADRVLSTNSFGNITTWRPYAFVNILVRKN